jgi:hypothetical protein
MCSCAQRRAPQPPPAPESEALTASASERFDDLAAQVAATQVDESVAVAVAE